MREYKQEVNQMPQVPSIKKGISPCLPCESATWQGICIGTTDNQGEQSPCDRVKFNREGNALRMQHDRVSYHDRRRNSLPNIRSPLGVRLTDRVKHQLLSINADSGKRAMAILL